MTTEPRLEQRDAQPYVEIQTRAAMNEMDSVIPQRLGEVFAWLGAHGVAPAGPPFVRYYDVSDMSASLQPSRARCGTPASRITTPIRRLSRTYIQWETEFLPGQTTGPPQVF
jgi:hypothetical protein